MEPNGVQNTRQPSSRSLACRPCQRRKIKCDRHSPCLQCEQSGISCESSSRKERAKPRIRLKREDDLRNRVASLESLVHRLNSDEVPSSTSSDILPSANKYLASPFWSSLANEVQSLREALEDDGNKSDLEPLDSDSGSSPPMDKDAYYSSDGNFEFIMCRPQNILVLPDALYEADKTLVSDLYALHRERTNRTTRVFHEPSLRALTVHGRRYLGYEADAPCNQALKAGILFSSISQLTDEECELKYQQSRANLLDCFRRSAEMKLIQADLMNTTALAALQALLLYLGALRRNDASRRSWAMFALLVRLARALNLHRESTDENFFMRELRRRLWHNIVVLDGFFALDRGSEPLITLGSFSRPLPTNLNDNDFSESTASAPERVGEVTEMTFALVQAELSACIHRINFLEDKPAGETWQQRLRLAQAQEVTIVEKYTRYCDPNIDFQRLILTVSKVILTGLTLRAVRPMQRDPSDTLPAIDSPWVFELGVSTLRQYIDIGSDTALQKWKQLVWVPWHPIAVVLAGLCSAKELGATLEAEAWLLVDQMMVYSKRFVADTKRGNLWQPIEKLYKRALASKRARDMQRSEAANIASELPQSSVSTGNNTSEEKSSDSMILDYATIHDGLLPNGVSVDHNAGTVEMDDWLDWDVLIADIDAAANSENDILWA